MKSENIEERQERCIGIKREIVNEEKKVLSTAL